MQFSCLARRQFTPFAALTVVGSKNIILAYFLKRNSFHLLVTQDVSWEKFEGKRFSDLKCSGPLLQTLPHKHF